jgi:uncharacterized membrane protein
VLNWFLYSYGIVIACLLVGARMLRHRGTGCSAGMRRRFSTCWRGCGFALNIEIADGFSTGASLTFDFSASLAQRPIRSAWVSRAGAVGAGVQVSECRRPLVRGLVCW